MIRHRAEEGAAVAVLSSALNTVKAGKWVTISPFFVKKTGEGVVRIKQRTMCICVNDDQKNSDFWKFFVGY